MLGGNLRYLHEIPAQEGCVCKTLFQHHGSVKNHLGVLTPCLRTGTYFRILHNGAAHRSLRGKDKMNETGFLSGKLSSHWRFELIARKSLLEKI